jgi:hypothetical protein
VPPQSNHLMVVSVRVAIALLIGFVLFLAIPLATRAGLQNAGKEVPRALDVGARPRSQLTLQFFCNMIIAGTIIFGGGPVVVPLLRGYVVAEGECNRRRFLKLTPSGWVRTRDFLLVFAIL